ncbi:M4 family metallopeptidase [Mesorhizobium sp. CO1-1-8]|uniref:M4 family metallopeptidase n=1 Tax=Mesorhizobium sp. CO1-1-8 TaxID=2876631 RepID=UPI001CD04E9D|nr:M4 family metallopeptidase [Mesorhizobium sp. CO1-1-8]MBZ9772258.1 M4 family metallopeptidase [Mesorhizobium sp. CO1-1-8]
MAPAGDDRSGNGLKSFSIHAQDEQSHATFTALEKEQAAHPTFAFPAAATESVDPETAARRYLNQALESKLTPTFVAPTTEDAESQFKTIGTDTVPLTGTRTVKFRQAFHDIPVYGSLVTVELDESNRLVSINSALGEPTGVQALAKISPAEAAKAVVNKPPFKKDLTGIAPRLNYYYVASRAKWHLAFIFEDVPVALSERGPKKTERIAPRYFDYVVDAKTGRVIAELPRTPSMASEVQNAIDARQIQRSIRVETIGNRSVLKDTTNNIETFDFRFDDPTLHEAALPGQEVSPVWPPGAVSAHANAEAVADFLRTVLMRNNIDNQGGPMNASVNCVVASESRDGRQWFNAYWNGQQMVYGQVMTGGHLLTLAAALDIVGHEMFHGVTDNTSRLEYAGQSGALNESYSDIFGILIANRGQPDRRQWDWKLGQGFASGGRAFRDMSDPASLGQPAHMNDFRVSPNTQKGDWGGVHTNSGIHNKAAHRIMTAADDAGFVFEVNQVAGIFYIAVTQQLSRTSQFTDSRRSVLSAARTLFRNLPADQLARRVSAIEAAFDAVGIP